MENGPEDDWKTKLEEVKSNLEGVIPSVREAAIASAEEAWGYCVEHPEPTPVGEESQYQLSAKTKDVFYYEYQQSRNPEEKADKAIPRVSVLQPLLREFYEKTRELTEIVGVQVFTFPMVRESLRVPTVQLFSDSVEQATEEEADDVVETFAEFEEKCMYFFVAKILYLEEGGEFLTRCMHSSVRTLVVF